MRKANGMGSVYKLRGKRRKPWAARVSIGYDDSGVMKRKIIGTYPTRKEAEKGLAEWLYLPENLRAQALKQDTSMTLEEAWTRWIAQATIAKSTIRGYKSAYKKLKSYYSLPLNAITTEQLQDMVDLGGSYGNALRIKNVLSAVYNYAYAHEGCEASKVKLLEYVKLPKSIQSTLHKPFTDEEIQQCFEQKATAAIIFIFTGLRLSELMSLKEENVNYARQSIKITESKTAAGYREVPIPDGLIPWVEEYFKQGSYKEVYGFKRHHWEKEILAGHTTHDGRHTYITLLQKAGVSEWIIKKLAGHSASVTEAVYTHITFEEKLDAVNSAFKKYFT